MKYKDSLGERMKEYERVSTRYLTRRMPVILRIDGCHFHTFTRGFKKPFDDVLIKTMQETTKYLCENIQGCVLGYTQSDEITLVLVDYKKLTSSAWFDNRQNKIESVAASMATIAFNKLFENNLDKEVKVFTDEWLENGEFNPNYKDNNLNKIWTTHKKAIENGVYFDCRAFNIPKEDVANNLYWRQLDATRNSIQSLGQAYFSHKELQNKTCNKIQDMLMVQKNINWNNLPTVNKRGTCIVKQIEKNNTYTRNDYAIPLTNIDNKWFIDKEIPIFSSNLNYINSRINFSKE